MQPQEEETIFNQKSLPELSLADLRSQYEDAFEAEFQRLLTLEFDEGQAQDGAHRIMLWGATRDDEYIENVPLYFLRDEAHAKQVLDEMRQTLAEGHSEQVAAQDAQLPKEPTEVEWDEIEEQASVDHIAIAMRSDEPLFGCSRWNLYWDRNSPYYDTDRARQQRGELPYGNAEGEHDDND